MWPIYSGRNISPPIMDLSASKIHPYLHVYLRYVCMYVFINACMIICTNICLSLCLSICICMYSYYVITYVCMYVCVYGHDYLTRLLMACRFNLWSFFASLSSTYMYVCVIF